MANYSTIFVLATLETYFKKFFFLLDFSNENKLRQQLKRVTRILLVKKSIDGEELKTIFQKYTGGHEDNKLREKTD